MRARGSFEGRGRAALGREHQLESALEESQTSVRLEHGFWDMAYSLEGWAG